MEGCLLPLVVVCYLRMANYKSFITTTTQVPTRLPFTLRVIFHDPAASLAALNQPRRRVPKEGLLSQAANAQTCLRATSGLRLEIHLRKLLGL